MKKTLLAMAIAGIIAAPAAQADTANTTVYGKVHYSWDFVDYDTTAADTTDSDDDATAVNRASRIGLKGTEDLGNGLKALYMIELGLGGTAGAATGERLAYVGVTGDFGTVTIGNQYKPYKLSTASLDVFADTVGDYNEVISNGYDGYNYETAANAVAYISPKFSGAQVAIGRVSVNAAEEAGDEETEGTSLSVTYGAGPLYVGFGWENQTAPTAGAGTGTDVDAIKIGAGYTMGDMKVGFIWENISEDTNGVETTDRDRWLLNGSYAMGANTLMLAYGDMDNNDAAGGATNDGASVLSVGVSHAMSKRTSAYAIYSSTDNDTTGTVDINNYTARAANQDVSAFSFGVVHNF